MKKKKDINWKEIGIIVITSLFFAVLLNVFFDISPKIKLTWKLKEDANVTYQDLAATLLTGAGVLITVLGVIIAILAFVGFRHIKVAAVKKAVEHITNSIDNEKGDLHKLVKQEVNEIVYSHLRGTEANDDWPEEVNND